jgi:hypothetical protein
MEDAAGRGVSKLEDVEPRIVGEKLPIEYPDANKRSQVRVRFAFSKGSEIKRGPIMKHTLWKFGETSYLHLDLEHATFFVFGSDVEDDVLVVAEVAWSEGIEDFERGRLGAADFREDIVEEAPGHVGMVFVAGWGTVARRQFMNMAGKCFPPSPWHTVEIVVVEDAEEEDRCAPVREAVSQMRAGIEG